MKNIYVFICVLIVAVPLLASAQELRQEARVNVSMSVDICLEKFEQVLTVLKSMDCHTEHYLKAVCVGMMLIELATKADNGLTVGEQIAWCQYLLCQNNERLLELQDDDPVRIALFGIKRAIIVKMLPIVKKQNEEYAQSLSAQEGSSGEYESSSR